MENVEVTSMASRELGPEPTEEGYETRLITCPNYTNEQPALKETKYFDLAIITQEETFKEVKTRLDSRLNTISTYYKNNSGKRNPSKIEVSALHLNSQLARRKLDVVWVAARNNTLRKLTNSKWGPKPEVLRTTAVPLGFSTGEYMCPVWSRQA
ncbi:hypothetical protein Trydic_g3956 [Trypoxylus dichotomus]